MLPIAAAVMLAASVSPAVGAEPVRPVRLAWFVYRDGPKGCPKPYENVAKYLGEKIERQVKPIPIFNYDVGQVVKGAAEGKIDAAYFTPYAFILTNKQLAAEHRKVKFKTVASYMSSGESERFSTIVWRGNDGFANVDEVLERLKQDRGKKMAFVNVHSTSGYLWPSIWLLGKGIDIVRGGDITTVRAGAHDKALMMLLDNPNVLAAATFDEELEAFEKHVRYRRNKKEAPFQRYTLTPALPLDAVAVRDDSDGAWTNKLTGALKGMNEDKEGQRLLKTCFEGSLDRWTEASDAYYQLVEAYAGVTESPGSLSLKDCSEQQAHAIESSLGGWFAVNRNGDSTADAQLTCQANWSDAIPAGVNALLQELQRQHPLSGYLVEENPGQGGGVRVRFGAQRGIEPGMVAVVSRNTWVPPDEPDVAGEPEKILARIVSVEGKEARLIPIVRDQAEQLRRELDPRDRVSYSVEVTGYPKSERGTPGLEISAEDASIQPDGNVVLDFTASVRDAHGDPFPADKQGWVIEVEPDSRASVSGDPRGRHIFVLQLGESSVHDQLFLSRSMFGSGVTARLLDARTVKAYRTFGLWSGIRVWIYVLAGALLGAALRMATLLARDGMSRRPSWWVRRVVELVSGVATGMATFMAFAFIRLEPFKTLDPNALVSRILTGGVGGIIGASGLATLVNRLLGLGETAETGAKREIPRAEQPAAPREDEVVLKEVSKLKGQETLAEDPAVVEDENGPDKLEVGQ